MVSRSIFFLAFIFLLFVNLTISSPDGKIRLSGGLTDFVTDPSSIYTVTENGFIEIFDKKSRKLKKAIKLEKIKNAIGSLIDPKIFSVDISPDNLSFMIVSEAKDGKRMISVYKNGSGYDKLYGIESEMLIVKTRYFDNDKIILALISNELILYSLSKGEQIYKVHPSESFLSDLCISEDRSFFVTAAESGELVMINTKSGKVLKRFKGINKDQVLTVDINLEKIAAGGKDRILAVYDIKGSSSFGVESEFPIYSVALSEEKNWVAYSINERNDIAVYDIDKRQKVYTLKGHKSPLQKMEFDSEFGIITADNGKDLMIWRFE